MSSEQLCKDCKGRLTFFRTSNKVNIKEHNLKFNIKKENIKIGVHYRTKARKLKFDLNEELEIIRKNGEMIEVQSGTGIDEFKYIFRYLNKDKAIRHAILLSTPTAVKIINVYNPKVGMYFKWNDVADKRVYLNTMRGCCDHPKDHRKYHNKRHHGIRHRAYHYQKAE